MPQATIFRWRAGRGWLVLSGGGARDSDDVLAIETNVLTHTVSQGPLAYIWAATDPDQADRHLDSLRDLGARTGYLIDILSEDDATLHRQLAEAGIIILADGPQVASLREALAGPVLDGIAEAYQRGATIYAMGDVSPAFGAFMADGRQLVAGYDWLQHALIFAHYAPADVDVLPQWVDMLPTGGYGLGLGAGAALALGPLGRVEVWGNRAVTVSLGRDYGADGTGSADSADHTGPA